MPGGRTKESIDRQRLSNEDANALFRMARDGDKEATEFLWEILHNPLKQTAYKKCQGLRGITIDELVDGAWIHFMANYNPDKGLDPTTYIPFSIMFAAAEFKKSDGWSRKLNKETGKEEWQIPYRVWASNLPTWEELAATPVDLDKKQLIEALANRPDLCEEFFEFVKFINPKRHLKKKML
jgi:DNA-directed RNA polymerase specialized sigma subunit